MREKGGIVIEYAVPHRINVIPDNVMAVFNMLGLEDSILLEKYQGDIFKVKGDIEEFLYRSFIYLWPFRDIIVNALFPALRDWWQIGHINSGGEVEVVPYRNVLDNIADTLEEKGQNLTEPGEGRREAVKRIIKRLFESVLERTMEEWSGRIYDEVKDFTWIEEVSEILNDTMVNEMDLVSRDVLLKLEILERDKDIVEALVSKLEDTKGRLVVSLSVVERYSEEKLQNILSKVDRGKLLFYTPTHNPSLEAKAKGFGVVTSENYADYKFQTVFLLDNEGLKGLGFTEEYIGKKVKLQNHVPSFILPLNENYNVGKLLALGVMLLINNLEIDKMPVTFKALLISAIEEYLKGQGLPVTRRNVDSILNAPGMSSRVTQELNSVQEERLGVLRSA